MKLTFDYGTRTIAFDYSYRKRKTLEIAVEPPDAITVVAPIGTSEEIILKKVKSKAKWIVERLYFFKDMEYRKVDKEFVNGEAFLYLGRSYSLQIEVDSSLNQTKVTLFRGKLTVRTPEKNEMVINKAIEEWYREKTSKKVMERLKYYQHYLDVKPTAIRVKDQKKRWASCTTKDELYFNWRCIMAPAPAFDYIVVHELCHLIHRNHSKEFWDMVGRILPDFERRKEWLKNYGVKLDL